MTEMILRLATGVMRFYRSCNDYVRGSRGVIDIAHKVGETRLKWLGYVVVGRSIN